VTLEIVIFALMTFITKDNKIYDSKSDTPASARSTAVSDLGQVK